MLKNSNAYIIIYQAEIDYFEEHLHGFEACLNSFELINLKAIKGVPSIAISGLKITCDFAIKSLINLRPHMG